MEDEEDNISNSVHALHNGDNNTSLRASQPSHTSPPSSQSRKKSPPKNLFKADSGSMMTSQTSAVSQDSNSPDFSTSSLISCSEHYNGESVLDNISPKSPSSPETPEWSLMDSYHKSKPGNGSSTKKSKLSPSKELSTPVANGSFSDFADIVERHSESISSSGNRVVITINNSGPSSGRTMTSPISVNGSRNVMSPGGSSTGTITPEVKNVSIVGNEDCDDDFFNNDDDRFDVVNDNVIGGGNIAVSSPQGQN